MCMEFVVGSLWTAVIRFVGVIIAENEFTVFSAERSCLRFAPLSVLREIWDAQFTSVCISRRISTVEMYFCSAYMPYISESQTFAISSS